MGSMSVRKIVAPMSILVLVLTNCASKKTLGDLGTGYEKANQAAVNAVSVESKQVKRVRRIGAVIAYINKPKLSAVENINAEEIHPSFINFVCTGEDDFASTSAGLRFTSDYAKTVNAITKAPEDSIGGYIDALSGLKGKGGPLALPEIKTSQFAECREKVKKDLPSTGPTGYTAVTARKEAVAEVIAAVEAVQALITSIQKLVKWGLKKVTEAEQIAALKSFIEENEENYQRVLTNLSSDELQKAFERRRQIAVAAPYYAFEDMMKLSTTKDRREIIKRAVEIDQDLAEYDAIRILQPPVAVVGQFKDINLKLQSFLKGEKSLAEIIQFLSETASELEDAKKDYDDVATKYQSLLDALKKLK